MEQVRKEGERKSGAFDASYYHWWEYDYLDCILTIHKRGELHYAWEDYMPDWMEDFAYGTLYYCFRMWYGEKYDWKPQPWLYTLREDAMLIDLARHCKCTGGIARRFGSHHISRPFPPGE